MRIAATKQDPLYTNKFNKDNNQISFQKKEPEPILFADGLPEEPEAGGVFKYLTKIKKALPVIFVLALFGAAMFGIGDLLNHATSRN